jgi:hypothetical protein
MAVLVAKLEAAECQLIIELIEDVLQDLLLCAIACIPNAR